MCYVQRCRIESAKRLLRHGELLMTEIAVNVGFCDQSHLAGELDIAEITVKLHRGSVMRKMGVRRVPDLVRFAAMLARDSRQP